MELITAGNVTVDSISATNSNTVNTLTIDAVGAITFASAASTFNALTVEADAAVTANVDITTDVGALAIDADDDENAGTGYWPSYRSWGRDADVGGRHYVGCH